MSFNKKARKVLVLVFTIAFFANLVIPIQNLLNPEFGIVTFSERNAKYPAFTLCPYGKPDENVSTFEDLKNISSLRDLVDIQILSPDSEFDATDVKNETQMLGKFNATVDSILRETIKNSKKPEKCLTFEPPKTLMISHYVSS